MNRELWRHYFRCFRMRGMAYVERYGTPEIIAFMDIWASQQDDQLETRAAIVAYSARAGLPCNVRKTASLELLTRYQIRKAAHNG
ncbi:hypothetical protein AADZ49_004301 [Salmonella enterica]